MNTKSFLIKDTTKEERIALIKEWIPDDDGCSDNCGISLWDMYDAYIKGEKEISQINMEFRAITQKESLKKMHLDVDRDIQDDK